MSKSHHRNPFGITPGCNKFDSALIRAYQKMTGKKPTVDEARAWLEKWQEKNPSCSDFTPRREPPKILTSWDQIPESEDDLTDQQWLIWLSIFLRE